mgnify:FL=1|tara:strand:- start:14307 stop:15149 length:843 start_codon:yes stop_codon:yes gene_type:complete
MKWRIGDTTITRVVELTSSTIGNHILPQATEDCIKAIDWIGPFVNDDHKLVLSFHSLIIETESQTLVVDTCIGNDKDRTYPKWHQMQSSFLDDFAAAGFDRDTVDTVLCTHMHVDHVGWNTRLVGGAWEATFPNARYLYAEEEWAHWQNESQAEYGPVIDDSVRPIFDAGLADLVSSDHQVTSEVRLESTPGHTPGHVSVHITSQGEEALITGDMVHHPCQIAYPDWSTTADVDPDQSASTRARFLDLYADRPVLVIGTHFSGPTAGKLVRDGDSYRLDY